MFPSDGESRSAALEVYACLFSSEAVFFGCWRKISISLTERGERNGCLPTRHSRSRLTLQIRVCPSGIFRGISSQVTVAQ